MKARAWMRRLGVIILFASVADRAIAAPSVYPTGVTIYDPVRAYNCYILFGDHSSYVSPAESVASGQGRQHAREGESRLIDMNGNVIHSWEFGGYPTEMIDPQTIDGARGVIGVQTSSVDFGAVHGQVPGRVGIYANKEIGLVDWQGNIIWQGGAKVPGGALFQHHDWERLPNGHMLVLGRRRHAIAGFGTREMGDEVIYELDTDGNPIWTWTASQHLNELGFTREELHLVRASPFTDFFDFHSMRALGPNRWSSAGDTRFAPENILVSSRNANFIVIIERKSGRIVWRLGPDYPSRNLMVKPDVTPQPVNQISGAHDVHMIAERLPGAGNILVFDNQSEAGYPPVRLESLGGSRVLEIDPITKQIIWQYSSRSSQIAEWRFYTPFAGSAQRLPNGNTLIDEGAQGRAIQVTADGEIVWEYISPFLLPAPTAPIAGRPGVKTNLLYRTQAVPYFWVPDGTPHSEEAVVPPAWGTFRVP
jgi:hypothetical protein